MLKRLQLGVALAVLVGLLVMPAPVAAQPEPVFVFPFFCLIFGPTGLLDEVPAGTPILVGWGWFAENRGLVRAFVNAADFFFSVDGEPVEDTDELFGPIFNAGDLDGDGDDDYLTQWRFLLGVLPSGDYSFVTDLSLAHRTPDLVEFEGENGHGHRPFLWGPGTILEGDCIITVADDA